MREIKFRGKRYGDGAWVYGSLYQGTKEGEKYGVILNDSGYHLAPQDDRNLAIAFAENEVNVVIPDTIGQFTGLHDKNGKEVYEGDVLVICEYENMLKGVVCEESEHELFTLDELKGKLKQQYKSVIHYEDCTLFASEQDGCDIYLASLAGDMRKSYPIFEYEVIGNIHDNPELLKRLRL